MRRILSLAIILCTIQLAAAKDFGKYQSGTVVRMRLSECTIPRHGVMATLSSAQHPRTDEVCPEYTLVAEKVVFLLEGKTAGQLIPLAEGIDFRLENHELAVRVDDAGHESKFNIKEMMLKSQWESATGTTAEQASTTPGHDSVQEHSYSGR